MYRPDLYAGHPLASQLLVFPANVIWAHASLPMRLPSFVLATMSAIAVGFFCQSLGSNASMSNDSAEMR
jgi:hypothetical protein